MLKIKVNVFDPDSIQNAIDQLNLYKKTLQPKMNEIIEKLAVIGKQIVDYQYSGGTETDFYEVYCITNGNNAMIIAEGDGVMFLEFGAGVYTSDYTAELATEGLPPIFPGSYSQTEGRGFFRPGHEYWFYQHKKYVGAYPTRGFYMASVEMKEQAVEIAKKVFKK